MLLAARSVEQVARGDIRGLAPECGRSVGGSLLRFDLSLATDAHQSQHHHRRCYECSERGTHIASLTKTRPQARWLIYSAPAGVKHPPEEATFTTALSS